MCINQLLGDGFVAFSRSPVDHDCTSGITESLFTRKSRLGQSCHTNDITTVSLQTIDLGSSLKPRPLGHAINPFSDDIDACVERCICQDFTQLSTKWSSEVNMGYLSIFTIKKCLLPAPAVIDELIRDNHRQRRLRDATYSSKTDNLLHAQLFHCPDIGAIVDAVRRDIVATAMARQK